METIKCPYCECTVRMSDVDADGGACPECGAMITGSVLFDDVPFDTDEVDEELDRIADDDERGVSARREDEAL